MIRPRRRPESRPGSIRLSVEHWRKLRVLMQRHGNRAWLERAIDAEYARLLPTLVWDKPLLP